MIINSVIFW